MTPASALSKSDATAPSLTLRPPRWLALLWLSLAAAPLGCTQDDSEPTSPTGRSEPMGTCNAVTTEHALDEPSHVANCSPLPRAGHPPAGGDHYLTWAAFQSYAFAVPAGFLMHSMEHGAVVVLYNCPDGCPDEVRQAEEWIAGLPEDPRCVGTGTPRRAILTPDPELPTRWAASAWGFTLEADCLDAEAFLDFYRLHFGNGPEDLCAPGEGFTAAPCQ